MRQREDWLARRQTLAGTIAKYQQDGKVAIVESGMDCDGVQYWGRACVVPAHVMFVMQWEENTEKWADGPFNWHLASPEEEIEYGSRDRGMEAFEDGHPHVIYY
jgi:hypothetical protein